MSDRDVLEKFKAILYAVYNYIKTQCKEFLRWREVSHPEKDLIRVYYGHESIPAKGEKASGGIIKCQDLQEAFPNTLQGANVLYLVSSALPHYSHIITSYAKKSGARLVVNQNGVAIPAYHGDRTEVMNGPRRHLLQQADHVVYQSEYCKLSSDKYLTEAVKKYSILYNPVDTTVFCPQYAREVSATPMLIMTGSHHFFYRVAAGVLLVSCLKKRGIPVKMKVFGRLVWRADAQECQKELDELCRKEDVEAAVILGGTYRQVDAPGIYQAADIMVHTKYKDPCPRAVVEGLACGLPVIYSDSGGVPELVGKEAGIGISTPVDWENIHPPDPEQMADAVEQILGSYSVFAEAARERAVSRFDIQDWLKAHKEIFDELVAG